MFRLHKNRSGKSGEKIDFRFSQFKAVQVPKGWDKLFVSLINVETGKTIAKTSKELVRNGNCQWTESLSESIWVLQDDSSKEFEDFFLKLVVSMGSGRSSILGEVIVNMTSYTESTASIALLLPLKKCNFGTTLQVKIQCPTPKAKHRNGESVGANPQIEALDTEGQDLDINSEESNIKLAKSIRASSGTDMDSSLHSGETWSREASSSASGSRLSYGSADGSVHMENSSPRNNFSGDRHSLIESQDSISSQNSSPLLKQSSSNSQATGSGNHYQNGHQDFVISPSRIAGSSKNLLETAEDTIEELRAEAKMWERNARKLMLDLEMSRNESFDKSKHLENLKLELSAASVDRDGLKKEVEQLKLLLEKSVERQTEVEVSSYQDQSTPHIHKELKEELKFQKESNANLALQLERSQESNIELVSVLRELEETIGKQKVEIDRLLALQSKFNDMANPVQVDTENQTLLLQLQQLKESEKSLLLKVQELEQDLEEKHLNTENNTDLNKQTLLTTKTENYEELHIEEEGICLNVNFPNSREQSNSDTVSIIVADANLVRQIEMLKEKVQELEKDCNELTDENLELLYKLKQANNNSKKEGLSFNSTGDEFLTKSFVNFEPDMRECGYQEPSLEDLSKEKVVKENHELESLKLELEVKVAELSRELTEKRSEIATLDSDLLSKEEEIEFNRLLLSELQAKFSDLQKEKDQLEEQMVVMRKESDITSKCLNHMRNDITVLRNSVSSHVSTNMLLERKSEELERGKQGLELQIAEMEQENTQLSVHVSDLEAELICLKDEKQCIRLEVEDSKSHAARLQCEISRLRIQMETKKEDLKQQLNDVQNRCSDSQEHYQYLKKANMKLQATVESLTEECNSLQKLNGDLRKQNLELHEHCSLLNTKLKESNNKFAECSQIVDNMEDKLSLMLEHFTSKAIGLTSEFDALQEEIMNHEEKLIMCESLLNQMDIDKTVDVEVEKLQKEVDHLNKQLSATLNERETIDSKSMHELSALRAEKAKLEYALGLVQSEVKSTENRLTDMQIESETKLQDLMHEIAVSTQNLEMLMTDNGKLSKLLETYKSDEVNFKTIVSNLESKLTVSECERQQLMEKSTNLKIQLENNLKIQDEALAFRNQLETTVHEKGILESSLNLISKQCVDLKTENKSLVEKILILQKEVSELEDCKRDKVTLEERLRQMEDSILAKEALSAQDADLRDELSRIKRANSQYLRKIKVLEEEKEDKKNQRESGTIKGTGNSKINTRPVAAHKDTKLLKNDMVKITGHHNNRRKLTSKHGQLQELVKVPEDSFINQCKREDNSEGEIQDEIPHAVAVDPVSRIQSLENELAETVEAKKNYKLQLSRLLSDGWKAEPDPPNRLAFEGELVPKETYEQIKSSLEAELKDLRDRYLHMSLKFAEVESQREELVMKLKAAKNGKRFWFS